MVDDNLVVGWAAVLIGIISGIVGGLLFHDEDWLGGYGSFRRRLARLGHVSFFGLGILNLIFAATAAALALPHVNLRITSISFIVAVISMPICCFLTAWRKPLRHLFPIPVAAALAGVAAILLGLGRA